MLRESAPLLGVSLLVVLIAWTGGQLAQLAAGGRPSAPLGAAFADGFDELYIRAQPVISTLSVPLSGYAGVLSMLALGCLILSLNDTLTVLRSRLHGFDDVVSFTRSVTHRLASAVRASPRAIVWGQLYDEDRQKPVPFARVTLYAQHTPLATAISDTQGRYGFALTRSALHARGIAATLEVRKDGYSGERLSLGHSDAAGLLHIPLRLELPERETMLATSRVAGIALAGAIVIAPAVLVLAPGVWSAALLVGVIVAMLLRGSLAGM